jgi:hypothetical protein
MADSNNLMARLAEPAMQAMIKTYMQKFDDIQTLLKTIFKNQAIIMDKLEAIEKKL